MLPLGLEIVTRSAEGFKPGEAPSPDCIGQRCGPLFFGDTHNPHTSWRPFSECEQHVAYI
jgi:hypothetical protein